MHGILAPGPADYQVMMVNMLDREQAWKILCEFTQSEGLRKHALAVEACVAAYARKLGEDEDASGPSPRCCTISIGRSIRNLPDHPIKGEPILAERGVDEEIRRAILSHANFTGVPRLIAARKDALSPATSWPASSPRSPM